MLELQLGLLEAQPMHQARHAPVGVACCAWLVLCWLQPDAGMGILLIAEDDPIDQPSQVHTPVARVMLPTQASLVYDHD